MQLVDEGERPKDALVLEPPLAEQRSRGNEQDVELGALAAVTIGLFPE